MGDWRVGLAMVVMNGECDNRLTFFETLEESVVDVPRLLYDSRDEWSANDNWGHCE